MSEERQALNELKTRGNIIISNTKDGLGGGLK